MSPSTGAGTASPNADNPLYARTADELNGTDIVDASGKGIGEIKDVVLTQDRRSAHAVVSVGGFLGIGDHTIAVSLDEFQAVGDDKLQLNATKEDLKARPKFQSEQYVELEGDQPISGSITDFAAFETDRAKTAGTPPDSDASKTMDKTMDKDKNMRQPSTGSGGTTGSGATGSGTTGSGTPK
jgi:sporulation protein YlmC with PRC-barrel domain